MANVKLVLLPILVTNHIVINIQRVADLGPAVVPNLSFAPPHPQRNITVPNVPAEMLRFYFWESADGVSLDTNLGSADIDASLAFEALIRIFEITVDGVGANDPADGADTYINADLIDADLAESGVESTSEAGVYTVQQRGVGQKFNDELQNNPVAGGFTLLGGDKFSSGDKWIVTLYIKVLAQNIPITNSVPTDIIEKTNMVEALTADDLEKELEAAYVGGPVQTFQMPDLGTLADNKYIAFNTHRFAGNYLFIDFSNGGSMYWNGVETAYFYMAPDEVLHIQIKGHKARIVNYDGNAKMRGEAIGSFQDIKRGFVKADGTQYTQAQMPGLYQMVSDLPGGVAASFTDWAAADVDGNLTNKSRWAIDVATTSIKVPDLRNLHRRFLKLAADAERHQNVSGGGQIDKYKSHGHAINTTNSQASVLGTPDAVRGNITGTVANPRGQEAHVGDDNHTIKLSGGVETRGINYGETPFITL